MLVSCVDFRGHLELHAEFLRDSNSAIESFFWTDPWGVAYFKGRFQQKTKPKRKLTFWPKNGLPGGNLINSNHEA